MAEVLIGVFLGLLSGLLPGLHSNTIISVISSLGIDDESLALIIIALLPAHLVTSFIPAIFFGIPESGTVVAVLPGQRMVLRGGGLVALKVILFSSIIAALLSIALFYFSLGLFPLIYGAVRQYMGWILLAVSATLLAKSRNPALALAVFLCAGTLGYFSLGSDMKDPFLPLFSGMFAVAAIVNYRKTRIPKQEDKEIGTSFIKFSVAGVFFGFMADLIPGVGSPSQVATFLSIFLPLNTIGYLAAISSISVSEAIFSLSTSASIDKSRIGATVWLSELIDIESNLAMLLTFFLISMVLTVGIIYVMRKHIAKLASLDFSRLNIILGLYLVSITFVLDGFFGLLVLAAGGALGLATLKLGAERINLMGAIIVPTLLYFF